MLFCLTSGVVLPGDVVLLDEEVLFLTRCRFAGGVVLLRTSKDRGKANETVEFTNR